MGIIADLTFFISNPAKLKIEDGAPMKLSDAEYETALTTVKTAAAAVGAEVAIMYEKNAGLSTVAPIVPEAKDKDKDVAVVAIEPPIAPSADVADQPTYKSSYVMIRRAPKSVDELLELRVAVVGNVVSGCLMLFGRYGALKELYSFLFSNGLLTLSFAFFRCLVALLTLGRWKGTYCRFMIFLTVKRTR
jgi:hypothetical protein